MTKFLAPPLKDQTLCAGPLCHSGPGSARATPESRSGKSQSPHLQCQPRKLTLVLRPRSPASHLTPPGHRKVTPPSGVRVRRVSHPTETHTGRGGSRMRAPTCVFAHEDARVLQRIKD